MGVDSVVVQSATPTGSLPSVSAGAMVTARGPTRPAGSAGGPIPGSAETTAAYSPAAPQGATNLPELSVGLAASTSSSLSTAGAQPAPDFGPSDTPGAAPKVQMAATRDSAASSRTSAMARPGDGARGSDLRGIPAGLHVPVICSEIVFQPLIAGCSSLLGPITAGGLARTGTPLQGRGHGPGPDAARPRGARASAPGCPDRRRSSSADTRAAGGAPAVDERRHGCDQPLRAPHGWPAHALAPSQDGEFRSARSKIVDSLPAPAPRSGRGGSVPAPPPGLGRAQRAALRRRRRGPPPPSVPRPPRNLNNLARDALIAAAAAHKDLVDDACAKKAVAEFTAHEFGVAVPLGAG
jgi:hypothetical protein